MNNEPDGVDVSQLTESQRDMLWMRLRADDVLFVFDGQTVNVPSTNVDELTSALSWIKNDLQPMPEVYPTPRPLLRVADDGAVVASRLRRLIGWYIDAALIGLSYAAAHLLGVSMWMLLPLSALYTIAMTHTWGRTVGKFVAGTQVVDDATGGPPSWSHSTMRWGVVAFVGIAASLFGHAVGLLLGAVQIAIYAPILWDRRGRGLHDVVAGTYVRAVER